eukprot:CAMPEP_0198269748 /NCGR_PEP_ID=MMETSP1447-20131203/42439_1 /TAXON_ID=420782 /ORGANISM="Chaetoceros dichaeta, Strain CCMP1751" /LENGTH=132 /DNA_ID=CAMNT_0043961465 /DNA_START=42 /DNA_END=440 /DNA_ORIENTATION=+
MHADGATEAIVDMALQYRKPFVVVPCCVFPNFFQHRFVPVLTNEGGVVVLDDDEDDTDTDVKPWDGGTDETNVKMMPVRTHEDFCRYLALKDSHFIVETLPFEGRNVAIWWNGIHRDGDTTENDENYNGATT